MVEPHAQATGPKPLGTKYVVRLRVRATKNGAKPQVLEVRPEEAFGVLSLLDPKVEAETGAKPSVEKAYEEILDMMRKAINAAFKKSPEAVIEAINRMPTVKSTKKTRVKMDKHDPETPRAASYDGSCEWILKPPP
jgi:hypothetical protein